MNGQKRNLLRAEDVIIERRDRLRTSHHLTGVGVLLMVWGVLLWLLAPLLILLLWWLGLRIGYDHMILLEGWRGLADLKRWFAITTVMCVALIVWARSRLYWLREWHYRSDDQRDEWQVRAAPVDTSGIAEWFKTDARAVTAWRTLRRFNVYFNEEDKIMHVMPLTERGDEMIDLTARVGEMYIAPEEDDGDYDDFRPHR